MRAAKNLPVVPRLDERVRVTRIRVFVLRSLVGPAECGVVAPFDAAEVGQDVEHLTQTRGDRHTVATFSPSRTIVVRAVTVVEQRQRQQAASSKQHSDNARDTATLAHLARHENR